MKSKSFVIAFITLLNLLIALKSMGQEKQYFPLSNQPLPQAGHTSDGEKYTYRLFAAPNKVFGYDIFRNGRIIFHQFALPEPPGNKQASIKTQAQAGQAATMAIEKIKRGISPELTRDEITQITSVNNSNRH